MLSIPSVLVKVTTRRKASPCSVFRIARAIASVLLVLVSAPRVDAQCGPTWNTFIGNPGANGSVLALATLSSGDVIVGGTFTSIGGIAANRIARYNPTTGVWTALGAGVNSFVSAVAVVPAGLSGAGNVIVAGAFTSAGDVTTQWVAQYNPTSNVWSALGTGLAGNGNNSSRADSLAIVPSGAPGAGEVIVGGFFVSAGGVPVSNVARFNLTTSTWAALGGGVSGRVVSVCVLPAGVPGAGDLFTSNGGASSAVVSRFNRSANTWSAVGTPLTNTVVNALAVIPGGNVVATGSFSSISGVTANRIARYNPVTATWSALGAGLASSGVALGIAPNGDLLVSGIFSSAGGAANTAGTARYNPTTAAWSSIGVGAGPASGSAIMALSSGDVIVGGGFTVTSPFIANNIARYTQDTGTTITTQPVARTVCPGSTATFSVAATASTPLSFRWQLNNVDIDAATNPSARTATLTLSNVQASNAGLYRCIVTSLCATTSNSVALTIGSLPVFTIQPPSSSSLCVGGSVRIECFMNAVAGPYTYRWHKNGTLISTATNASAATNQLQLSNFQIADAGSYTCEITNACGTVNSTACVVTWGGIPTITQQPQSRAVCPFSGVSLSVTASPNTFLYRWYKNGQEINITTNPSAATPTLSIASFTAASEGSYSCFVQSRCGADFSTAATLTLGSPANITNQPTNRTVCAGLGTSFTVGATGTQLTYQWRKGNSFLTNGGTISGATSATLNISSVSPADAATYTCIVTSACAGVSSNNATLDVTQAPIITAQPSSISVCPGSNASFTVTVSDVPAPTYQWRRGNINLVNGVNITGATSPSLTILSVSPADLVANYNCVITNSCGTVTTNNATLSAGTATSISQQPTDVTSCVGADAAFTVAANGAGLVTFQWQRNTINVDPGTTPSATAATLVLTNVSNADQGEYACIVTSDCGPVSSQTAVLTVEECSTCPADFNQDGGIDGEDVSVFFAAWEVADPSADVNQDGGIDGADVDYFFDVWQAGGC